MLHAHTSHSTPSRILAGAIVGLAVLAIVPLRLTARPASAPAQTVLFTTATADGPKTVAFEATPSRPQAKQEREPVFSYRLKSKQGQPTFVIFRGDTTHLMDGSREDLSRARQFRQGQEAMIWVRQEGREYVSRDATLLRQLHELWVPVSRLAGEQDLLSRQQSLISGRQSEISEQQSRLSTEQSKVSEQMQEAWARADREMRSVMAGAIASGVLQPVK